MCDSLIELCDECSTLGTYLHYRHRSVLVLSETTVCIVTLVMQPIIGAILYVLCGIVQLKAVNG